MSKIRFNSEYNTEKLISDYLHWTSENGAGVNSHGVSFGQYICADNLVLGSSFPELRNERDAMKAYLIAMNEFSKRWEVKD